MDAFWFDHQNAFLFCSVFSGGAVLNNEFDDVYLITTLDPIPLESLILQVRISYYVLDLTFSCVFFFPKLILLLSCSCISQRRSKFVSPHDNYLTLLNIILKALHIFIIILLLALNLKNLNLSFFLFFLTEATSFSS